ncbi:hypothetical protein GKZ68_13280 [Hymenobacter sp. BRD128]|uniref:hypothetical protein n=1 Tax=Hymenobacter sp. BRD128 TaxID=2675878 RepID=UPI001564C6F7|nr:hypothetical protein [Hymenobacter sp. BRD128]QKG57510.1 hypothetical protein GKZ68_13280 [Hymenobacter sp. BRD128]
MQNLTSTLGRLAVVLTGALALGSCSRANYAFLPKADSYLGTTAAAPKAHYAAPVATSTATPAQAAEASQVATPEAPAIAPEVTVATAPSAAATPKTAASAETEAVVAAAPTTMATTPVAAPKLNVVQRLALNKVMRKLNKQTQKISARQGDNTASTARGAVSGNLKIGIVLLLIGLLVGLLNGFIGAIIAVIGLIFIVLWLLDQI